MAPVVGPNVKAERHNPGNLRQCMLRRIGEESSDCEGHWLVRRVRRLPDLIQTQREIACSEQGIPPKAPRQPDMGPLALNPDIRIPEVARHSGSNRNRQPRLDQLGRLLDVHLHPGPYVSHMQRRLACPHRLDIRTAAPHVVSERAAVVYPPRLQRAVRQHPERGARTDVGDFEPNAFFRPYCHRGHIARWRDVQRLEGLDRNKPSHDTRRAIEIAAVRDRIEMRAQHDARPIPVASR